MTRFFVIGALIGTLLMVAILAGNDRDPAILLAIGEESPSREYTEQLMGRDVPLRPSVGHDGRFFFAQAIDPLYLGDTTNARQLDFELYRGQRMFFPLLIGLGGLAPAPAIPWMMLVVNVLAYAVGTAATAEIARQQGGSRWWGLAFPLNASLIMAVLIGGAGVLALALALAATAAVGNGRTGSAAGLFALSVLTREVMVLYLGGVVLFEWWRTKRLPWLLGGAPVVAFSLWYGYLLTRLQSETVFESNNGLGLPLQGFLTAARTWGDDPSSVVVAGITIALCVLIVRQFVVRPTPVLAGTVGFTVLAVLLSELVWFNSFDISRALAPIYTTFVVATFARPVTSDERADVSGIHTAANAN